TGYVTRSYGSCLIFFFFQAEDGIRDRNVTGVQTCALPIYIKKDIDNGEQPGEAVNAAMFQAMRDALAEQKQNPLSIDDVTAMIADRKSTRLNSSHVSISYAVFCLKKKIHSYLVTDLYYAIV